MPLLLLYAILIFGINLLHFILYYYLSGAPINQYNLIFTSIFSLFLWWLITLSAKKIWKTVNIILIISIALYYSANFLFFKVFHEFFNVWKFGSVIDTKNLSFFSAYLKDIPIMLYVINFAWMFLMIGIIISYRPKYLYAEKLPMMNETIFNTWKKNLKKYYLLLTIFFGLGLFITNNAYQYYLSQKPADYWWERSAQQQDFTIWGDLTYKTVFEPLGNFINKKRALASETIIVENIQQDDSPSEEQRQQTENNQLEIIKNRLAKLAKLNQQDLRRSCLYQENFTNKPHIVFIQLESVPSWALDQTTSVMPFLKKLKQDNLTVNHFFANSCETINAEFSSLCSFSVDSSGPIPNNYKQGNYYCLPQILGDKLGYKTNLYHANYPDFWSRDQLAPRWGFDNLHVSPEFGVRTGDIVVLDKLANDLKNAQEPNFNYFISFTSHSPHAENYVTRYNQENFDYPDIPVFTLNDLPIKLKNSIELTGSTTNYYLSLLKALDQSLEHFFNKLEEYQLLDKTIIFLYGDHRYYHFKPADTLENFYNYNEVPFIMVLPKNTGQGGASVASHLDIAPSLLDLLGQNELIPENFIGQSLFNSNFRNLAITKCTNNFQYVDQNIIIKGNSANQEYSIFHQFDKNEEKDTYLKLVPELNQAIDAYLPEMLLGE